MTARVSDASEWWQVKEPAPMDSGTEPMPSGTPPSGTPTAPSAHSPRSPSQGEHTPQPLSMSHTALQSWGAQPQSGAGSASLREALRLNMHDNGGACASVALAPGSPACPQQCERADNAHLGTCCTNRYSNNMDTIEKQNASARVHTNAASDGGRKCPICPVPKHL